MGFWRLQGLLQIGQNGPKTQKTGVGGTFAPIGIQTHQPHRKRLNYKVYTGNFGCFTKVAIACSNLAFALCHIFLLLCHKNCQTLQRYVKLFLVCRLQQPYALMLTCTIICAPNLTAHNKVWQQYIILQCNTLYCFT